MHPILLSLLLGLTAAAANVFGGTIIVQKNWDRSYLRYFVALGAGFMLATAIMEIIPESLALHGRSAAFLVLIGYLIIHFFEHTVTPHFHFGEETHADQFVAAHKGFSVLMGLVIHSFFDGIAIASGFIVSYWLDGSFFSRYSSIKFRKASPSRRSCWRAGAARNWPGALRCCSGAPLSQECLRWRYSASRSGLDCLFREE